MVSQITKGIKISVLTSFEGTYFKNYKIHFAFSYHITIENQSKDSVQLTYRDWETDRKSTRLNSSHLKLSRMPSSA